MLRRALASRDLSTLSKLLDPLVMEWCLHNYNNPKDLI